MFTTLLDDETDTLFESGLDTLRHLPPHFAKVSTTVLPNQQAARKEHFNDLAIHSVTLGSETAAGVLTFKPGSAATGMTGVYLLQNQNGVLQLVHADTATSAQSNFMTLNGAGEFTLLPLQMKSAGDTTDLVPVVVDATGKIQRGVDLYQSINANLTQLNSRVANLEANSAPVLSSQINTRLSDLETLGQKIRVRINGMGVFSNEI
jgi:hypothetical protein